MATHLAIGQHGENLAAEWLIQNGFRILQRNWRFGRKEIDLIATKTGILHIIEVKTRRGDGFGFPEQQVTAKKILALQKAAAAYLEINPQWRKIQFDILAILLNTPTNDIRFLEDIS